MRRALLVALLVLAACARNARPPERAPRGAELIGEGLASYYGPGLRGHKTANGERFDPDQHTAAHRTLPFDTCLVVENVANGRSVKVRVNDRGPYAGNRIIDVSEGAARALDMLKRGLARVRLWAC